MFRKGLFIVASAVLAFTVLGTYRPVPLIRTSKLISVRRAQIMKPR